MEKQQYFIVSIWQKYKIESIFFTMALIIAIISVLIYFSNYQNTKDNEISIEDKQLTSKDQNNYYDRSQKIIVDLSGAVQKPDAYELKIGSRLKDVLILAQGLSIDADRDFFARNFNLARLLKDQEKIYIPSRNEIWLGIFREPNRIIDFTQPQIINYTKETFQTPSSSLSRVNINKAFSKELEGLPGIGVSIAQKIIKNRPFTSVEELLSKKIINKNIYEKIKDLISTN